MSLFNQIITPQVARLVSTKMKGGEVQTILIKNNHSPILVIRCDSPTFEGREFLYTHWNTKDNSFYWSGYDISADGINDFIKESKKQGFEPIDPVTAHNF